LKVSTIWSIISGVIVRPSLMVLPATNARKNLLLVPMAVRSSWGRSVLPD
jgi:hypothetical protein